MARRSTPDDAAGSTIVDVDVSTEMRGSFLEYAYSVIYARALPDARDGLKPVQRRILYQMSQMGLRPDRGHVKSARVVGDVMGKLHPHGDTAIYDALVRMAQAFSLRLPLVDGHGNFGSLDDGPAAARYTEARLAPSAMGMTADLDADVVDFVPNYDSQLTQPEVLPAALPNLLVNGASGIAVGMATNMVPHNLIEVVAALRHLLAHPEADLAELTRFVPGPDLPSGGKIVGLEGIREAYATGRGSFRTRATTRIENITARRKAIVVTELPYQVGPERLIGRIKDAVQSKKVQGITAVTDLTDREHGLRLVIEVKSSFNPEAVLGALFQHTPMEDSFSINNVALVDGQPRTLGLRDLLQVYLQHRITVVRRRTAYHLARKQERAHLVAGLLIAIADIDEVIQVIRSSADAQSARERLMTVFDLSEAQAEYILALRLRRLTKYSRLELEAERDELAREITELQQILDDESLLHQVVGDELAQVAADHGTPRRTVLLESAPGASGEGNQVRSAKTAQIPLEVPDTPCHVLFSATGLLARTADDAEVLRVGPRSTHDALTAAVPATARGQVAALTNTGRLLRVSVVEIPALPPTGGPPSTSGGVPVAEMVMLEPGERVVTITTLEDQAPPLALGTRNGVVKRVIPEQLQRDSWPVITLKDDDQVVGAAHAADDDDLVFITTQAQLLRFGADAVRAQGRTGSGIAGVKLPAGVRVLHFAVVPQGTDAHVVTVAGADDALPGTVPGSAKVTPLDAYPPKGRGTGGVRAHRFLRGEDALYLAAVTPAPVRAVGSGGQAVDLPEVDDRRDGSGRAVPALIAGLG